MNTKSGSDEMCWVVVQEGGSSGERYVHAYDSLKDAEDFRSSAARAAYNTGPPVPVPRKVLDHPGVWDALCLVVQEGMP